ncbi:MAG: SpoIIE family protein phosphatase [Lentisphaeria bacterium]|nr:SpoIIE family protein phosphatase [Lentisphaeria bacterium]
MSENELELLRRLRFTMGKMELAMSFIDEALLLLDKDGNIQWCNTILMNTLTVPRILIIGKPFYKVLKLFDGNINILPMKLKEMLLKDQGSALYSLKANGPLHELSVKKIEGTDNLNSFVMTIKNVSKDMQFEQFRLQSYALNASDNAIVIVNAEGEVEWANVAFSTLTGYSIEEVMGENLNILNSNKNPPGFFENLWSTIRSGKTWQGMLINRRKDGSHYLEEQTITPVEQDGEIKHFIAIKEDVTERQELVHNLQKSERNLHMIHAITTASDKTFTEKVQSLLEIAINHVGMCFAALTRIEDDKLMIKYQFPEQSPLEKLYNIPIVDTLDHDTILAGDKRERMTLLEDAQGKVGAYLGMPVYVEEELYGTVALISQMPKGKKFTEVDHAFCRMVAQWVGNTITEERLKRKQNELTGRIQKTFLQGDLSAQVDGLEIASITIPSQLVDGDFFDFIALGNNELDLILGDVMGKGLTAALLGAATKTAIIRVFTKLLLCSESLKRPSPPEVMNSLHAQIVKRLIDIESFVTLCYARFNTKSKLLTYVDCGHTSTVHYRAKSKEIKLLQGESIPVGFSPRAKYESKTITFDHNDIFIFYSDGITEARNEKGHMFTVDKLIKIIKENAFLKSNQLLSKILEEVKRFCGHTELVDDLSCIVVKVDITPLGKHLKSAHLELTDLKDYAKETRNAIDQFLPDVSSQFKEYLKLGVHEALINVVKHAFSENIDELEVSLYCYQNCVQVVLSHNGMAFVASEDIQNSLGISLDSGYGTTIMENALDRIRYVQDASGYNHVEMIKFFEPENGESL